MVDYKKIAKAIILFLIGNIALGISNLSIIGIILMYISILTFEKYDKTSKVMKKLIIITFIVEISTYFISPIISLVSVTNIFPIYNILHFQTGLYSSIDIVSKLLIMYLLYQIYTIIANLTVQLDKNLGKKIKTCRNLEIISTVVSTVYLLVQIALMQLSAYMVNITNYYWISSSLSVLAIVSGIIACIYSLVVLIKAYKLFAGYEPISIVKPEAIKE